MSPTQSPKGPNALSRSRKSITHIPSMVINDENEDPTTRLLEKNDVGMSKMRKTRSKSLGPGGLDTLREGTGNQQKSDLFPIVRSILKPAVPLSPPKQIPPHHTLRKSSPSKTKPPLSPRKRLQDDLLVDVSIPSPRSGQSGLENVPNPFEDLRATKEPSQENRVSLRTEEEQQTAAKEREQRALVERRDARRKSLANRRVSFAPEATLHTWDVIELPEDATTSSEATNSTRRASNGSALATSPHPYVPSQVPGSDGIEPPLTPPAQVEEIQVTVSPAHQRDMHQKKRRRSSGIPPMNFNDPNEFSSSPCSSTVGDEADNQSLTIPDEDIDSCDSDDNDLVEGSGTIMEIDGDDLTTRSVASARSVEGSTTSSSDRLEAALQQAAKQAGTQGIDFDEHGDLTMEMADDEITASFKPWVKQGIYKSTGVGDLTSRQDQENLNPFSPAFKANLKSSGGSDDDEEQTMDFTRAAGAILPSLPVDQVFFKPGRRSLVPSARRRSGVNRRRSSGESSLLEDETMDLTTAFGDIQQREYQHQANEDKSDSVNDDEELTMEFTSVFGGVIDRKSSHTSSASNVIKGDDSANQQLHEEKCGYARVSSAMDEAGADMEMTKAIGGILEAITERTEPDEVDQTVTMDMTTAMGTILPDGLNTSDKSLARRLMESETDVGQLASSPFQSGPLEGHPIATLLTTPDSANMLPSETTDIASPSMVTAKNRSNARKSMSAGPSIVLEPGSRPSTPLKKPSTPSKQLTPKPSRPTTPGKTPPSKNVTLRTGSPKKLFKAEIKRSVGTPKLSAPPQTFGTKGFASASTHSLLLTPQLRRTSGLGINREGLGSPRLAALLDRRGSIGEKAETFTPQGPVLSGLRFEDPRVMEQALESERLEDERRESARCIMQMEADIQDDEEKDATTNLRGMIESLTPKKDKLKGRKSLHVGAARGLLGKRPAELDQDEDDDESTPKRLKGHEKSPIKTIRLPAPPSKEETTGKAINPPRFSLGETVGNVLVNTPSSNDFFLSNETVTTPKDQKRFKDVELLSSAAKPTTSFGVKLDGAALEAVEPFDEEDRIHLQEFLNMTSIRFMELTTTKRRHTVAPNMLSEDSIRVDARNPNSDIHGVNDRDLESCVVAGACTVPMLELYQHSCRELKKYISEGRNIVREIEADTYEENPPLFREYISAAPDVKSIMDSQFKNVKTHARLLSKAMWYEWRMKLLDGLKEGLLRINDGFLEDAEILSQQEELLHPVLPGLIEKRDTLAADAQLLQAQADELASCDQEELTDARKQLLEVNEALEAKRKMVADMQQQLREQEDNIECVVERKQECLEEIKEAEKVREDCKGWNASEVATLKAKVDALALSTGWSIVSASGPSLTLAYLSTLQLFLAPSSFSNPITPPEKEDKENSPISLTYIADSDPHHPIPLSTEKRFFLQILRARLQCLRQSRTKVKDVLAFVSEGWKQACLVAEEIRALKLTQVTDVGIVGDEMLLVKATILQRESKTKMEVVFRVCVGGPDCEGKDSGELGLQVDVKREVKLVYGMDWGDRQVKEFLNGTGKGNGQWGWDLAVRGLEKAGGGSGKGEGKGTVRKSVKGSKAQ
ncbi:MAG: hypothetical protein Q9187_002030 [Circinaria calcarea]